MNGLVMDFCFHIRFSSILHLDFPSPDCEMGHDSDEGMCCCGKRVKIAMSK